MNPAENLGHEDPEAGEPPFEIMFMRAVHDLWKHRLWVAAYLALVMAAAFAACFFQTPYYRATVEVLVNPPEKTDERSALKNLSLQEVIITSPKVVDAVISKMKLHELPLFGASVDISRTFLELLTVKIDSKSGTLEIRFDFPDPQKASDIANEVAKVYVDSNTEKSEGVSQVSREALKQQAQDEQIKQNKIRAKIAELVAQHPELSEEGGLPEQAKFFSNELLKTENRILEIQSTLDEIEGYMKRGEPLDLVPFIRNDPNIANKADRIRELELLLVELQQEYRGMHPEVTKAKAKLAALQNVLQTEELKIIDGLRGELRARERSRDELKGKIQKLQERIQGTTPAKIKHKEYLSELAATDETINMLNKRLSTFEMEGSLTKSKPALEILRAALPPQTPFKPNVRKSLFLALIFGFFSSFGVFFLKNYFSRTIHGPEEVYRVLRRPLVGQVVYLKKKGPAELEFTDSEAVTPLASMMGLISANSDFLIGEDKNYSLLVTSSIAGEGKTFVAYQLAVSFASKGKKTLLVDADLCRGRLTRHFEGLGVKSQKLLEEYLMERTDDKGLIAATYHPNLDFIGAGSEKASAPHVFRSPRIKELLARLKGSYNIVLFDAPPVLPVNDAVALSPSVDLRLLVINSGRTSQRDIHHALVKLDPNRHALIGIVLNQVPRIDRGYDYYKKSVHH